VLTIRNLIIIALAVKRQVTIGRIGVCVQ